MKLAITHLRPPGLGAKRLEPRQHFRREIRKLLEIVHEVNGQAVQPRRPKSRELPDNSIRITHDAIRPARQRSSRERIVRAVDQALGIVFSAALLRMHIGQMVDRAPVGVIDDVLQIVIGLPSG
jgi:hypothetical protein